MLNKKEMIKRKIDAINNLYKYLKLSDNNFSKKVLREQIRKLFLQRQKHDMDFRYYVDIKKDEDGYYYLHFKEDAFDKNSLFLEKENDSNEE